MSSIHQHLLPLFAALCAGAADACSCGQLEASPDASRVIVEVGLVEVTVRLESSDPIEYGTVRVRQAFKGAYRKGDLIKTKTNINGTACGWSLIGAPWGAVEFVRELDQPPFDYYHRWLLYLNDASPHYVSTCTASRPSHDRQAELEGLRKSAALQASKRASATQVRSKQLAK